MSPTKIELLAPARNLEAGRAAIDCGADAVYIGGPGFGARHAAGNPVEDIAALVRYARPFSVRVYATLNTLLFDNELSDAEQAARELIDAGVDAFIVQDMAWLRIPAVATAVSLGTIELHASTQTSCRTPQDAVFLGSVGFSRVILERALSLDEIRNIRRATVPASVTYSDSSVASRSVGLEVFVHGAICVGYSGRCFLSRAMTGNHDVRSGNRGNCSQPCRLAWDLVDSSGQVIIKGKHLLSVRDLDLSAHLGELLDAGVMSLKIEGRLKDIGYVRNVVSYYRSALDATLVERPNVQRASIGHSKPDFVPDLAKSFTRGASDYFFGGPTKGEASSRWASGVASFDTPKAMGEPVGRVEKVACERTGNWFFTLADPTAKLAPGDGICYFADGELRGTNINRIETDRIYPNEIQGITTNTEVYRNFDILFNRALERSRTRRKINVSARLEATAEQVCVHFTDETGLSVEATRTPSVGTRFDQARDQAKMVATAREELSRSGDTIFNVTETEIVGVPTFVPVSMLASLRREGLQKLLDERQKDPVLSPSRDASSEVFDCEFPRTHLTAAENVTNHLAEKFYRDHGVTEIEPSLELRQNLDGEVVMRTKYCIRRELSECLCDVPKERGDLFLERGRTRLWLDFDCAKCEMVATATAKLK